ncbi:hypothetical protein CO683_00960 [Bradyrhizobium ottawaense]|uniref:hypothetical protein n=1 Tax=Bradyrhizobium ottawaense TaxID=931866 RepID=UPI000BE8D312|nr:hypothetical protein [Bradyrhizobium ottawaense]PDT71761.1 hypothetical protein CO683_00960 [Bradyrhizobium ottawaense]
MNREKHAELDLLAAKIKAAEIDCEGAYIRWCTAAEKLKQLERKSREIWLSLFDEVGRTSSQRQGQL